MRGAARRKARHIAGLMDNDLIDTGMDASDLAGTLARLAKAVGKEGRKKLLGSLLPILRDDAREQFAAGGSPAWTPLKPATIRAKERAGFPARLPSGRVPTRLKQNGVFGSGGILIRTGSLRDSYGRKDSPNHTESVEDDTASIGSKLPYAGFMQDGTKGGKTARARAALSKSGKPKKSKPSAGGGGVPARPLVITQQAQDKAASALEQALQDAVSGL